MNRLVIGPEGFVDLRRAPPADKDRVNGWTPETGQPAPVETKAVAVEAPKAETLPARQKTTEGLARPEAPVRVPLKEKAASLKRIVSVNMPEVYALVTAQQFHDFGGHQWTGTRKGFLYRRDGDKVIWLHRAAAKCKRSDRWVAFRNGDQRDLRPTNLQVVKTKEKMKEIRRLALLAAAGK